MYICGMCQIKQICSYLRVSILRKIISGKQIKMSAADTLYESDDIVYVQNDDDLMIFDKSPKRTTLNHTIKNLKALYKKINLMMICIVLFCSKRPNSYCRAINTF